ncbi:16S rRNA (uracil(1498)-N(3))-methyltransferase [Pseudooctadecabacter jejudonensis]|uniref:Ribosomal RNA small subunit methyltransferase E n=1 Tax=Pseudooctadecabacter jejudonensis TaxID=1391910 RepID=A0A1Y5T255_9RHOB|nr:16S rRNA (uracil(1498)-N(3))-methyltransferase [Pseudooctadecabacter jejudonensis]SLN53862.1 Ribosomal RNA small subunit methyltransferase E [Pseudooctadecabacter jejudonensis]
MARKSNHIRLYVDHPLGADQRVSLTRDQAHYLFGVMRLDVGDAVALFNGRDGEWQTRVGVANKKGGDLVCQVQTRAQVGPPDLWLVCAPIRKERLSFMVEKAVELGVARIVLMQTDFTQDAKRVRLDKLQAVAVEAAEQCEALVVPEVVGVEKFSTLMGGWDAARRILFCDEAAAGRPSVLPDVIAGPWAVVIGPEGGFSDTEREVLQGLAAPVSLGPRILRAETAAVAALTVWQARLGDWV